MAADYVVVNRTKQQGNDLVRAANLTRELQELIASLKERANHQVDGSDYTLFETQTGVQTGKGANVVTLINIVDNILNGSGDVSGAVRQGQMQEFTARLSGQ